MRVAKFFRLISLCLILLAGLAIQSNAADILINPAHNYEIPHPFSSVVDLSQWPDTVVFGIGETGRLVIKPIELPEREDEYTNEEIVEISYASFASNFQDIIISRDEDIFTGTGLDGHQWDFDGSLDDVLISGFTRLLFGESNLVVMYYDYSSEYGYQLPDVLASVDAIRIDRAIGEMDTPDPESSNGETLDFVDPTSQRYINNDFYYECENPAMLKASEFSGTSWVVFSTGIGEVSIRYLDIYRGSSKYPNEIINELLDEIMVSFDRYTSLDEGDDYTNNDRSVSFVKLEAFLNSEPWSGKFICLISDYDEPFLIGFLAPEDEYETYSGAFETMWKSFQFMAD